MVKIIKHLIHFIGILVLLFSSISCGDKKNPAPEEGPEEDQELTYQNPVFSPVLADPSIVKSGDYFYAYGTEDDWGGSGGYHLVPIVQSKNLVDWEFVADAFKIKPGWKNNGFLWAPDVTNIYRD
jgi:arabinan endo-1,5-alpha-L-arabinosidase